MSFWHNINPTGAIGDFVTVFKQAGSNRWRFSVLAGLTTIGIFSVMAQESWKRPRPLPAITYITAWPADRTEAETRAFIEANQKRKDEMQARQEQYDEEGRRLWKALGRASGVDVETIDRKARAERAAEDVAARERAEKIINHSVQGQLGQ